MHLYHGTDERSALGLINRAPLDAAIAQRLKIDGPAGFFLAFDRSDAEFFALRRGRGVVVEYDISDEALERLLRAGSRRQPIPVGARSPAFSGDELFVPV